VRYKSGAGSSGEEDRMAVAVICTFPGGTTETYDDAVKAWG
jgi:hypothetical protein